MQRQARDSMLGVRERAIAAGHAVHVQVLSGRYADVKQFTDPGDDRGVVASAAPGEVVVCLRLALRLDGKAVPGRVLYQSR